MRNIIYKSIVISTYCFLQQGETLGFYLDDITEDINLDHVYMNTQSNDTKEETGYKHHDERSQNDHVKYEDVKVDGPDRYGQSVPNYECNKINLTLYVTQTSWVIESKCYEMFSLECQSNFVDGKAIEMKKNCNEFTETRCRTVFETKLDNKCKKMLKKKCETVYEEKVETNYKQNCTTVYVNQCKKEAYADYSHQEQKNEHSRNHDGYNSGPKEGYGHKESCVKVPKQQCKVIPEQVKKKVPITKCRKIKSQHCEDHPVQVSKEECKQFPKEVCNQDPVSVTKKIEKKECNHIPKTVCNKVPRQECKDVPTHVTKTICKSTKGISNHDNGKYLHPIEDVSTPTPHVQETPAVELGEWTGGESMFPENMPHLDNLPHLDLNDEIMVSDDAEPHLK